MAVRICGATEKDLPEVRELLRVTFRGPGFQPGAVAPFYVAYDICDPWFRPEQYRFRRRRGKTVSALKVYVRTLHHRDGPIPVTVIGAVCTAERLRGRGLIGPVIEDALAYSRRIGAKAQFIVTPRRNYYLRHGYRYFETTEYSGRLPEVAPKGVRIEPLHRGDAGWMTDLFNAASLGYGPIVRTEEYTGKWVLQMRLAQPDALGLKLLRRGRPAAYLCARAEKGALRIVETASRRRDGADEATLAACLRFLGAGRFRAHVPAAHPLLRGLRAAGARLRSARIERCMVYPLDDAFPMPDDGFCYSFFDLV